MKHGFYFLPLISALFLIFASCSNNFLSFDGTTWGTTFHIVYSASSNLNDSIRMVMDQTDGELSMFNDTSAISRVNSAQSPIAVSRRIHDIYLIATQVNAISGGCYDPTVAPLVELWGFGRTHTDSAPSDSAIAQALSYVGIGQCSISPEGVIVKKSPHTRFDFSSIAKGYGIDCIGKMFERNGVENYMIEIGGEVLAKGVNPKGQPWHIQIDSPEGGAAHSRLRIVETGPQRTAIATSGNYRNFRSFDSIPAGHIISPGTGRPAATVIASATVTAQSCALADALATALVAACTPDSAAAIARRAGVEAIIVDTHMNVYDIRHDDPQPSQD